MQNLYIQLTLRLLHIVISTIENLGNKNIEVFAFPKQKNPKELNSQDNPEGFRQIKNY